MILADTSVWVDRLRAGDPPRRRLLEQGQVLARPWVTAELALGHLRQRAEVVHLLSNLPAAEVVTPAETLAFVDRHELTGSCIGDVDVQLHAPRRRRSALDPQQAAGRHSQPSGTVRHSWLAASGQGARC